MSQSTLDQIWTEQREVKRQNEAKLAEQNLSEQTRIAREQYLKEALQAYLNKPSVDYKKLGLPDYQALLDRTWVRELVDKRLETMAHGSGFEAVSDSGYTTGSSQIRTSKYRRKLVHRENILRRRTLTKSGKG